MDAFSGTYTLGTSGQTMTITRRHHPRRRRTADQIQSPIDNGGTDLTIGTRSPLRSADRGFANSYTYGDITGNGGLVKNGDGVHWLVAAPSPTPVRTVVNSGVIMFQITYRTPAPSRSTAACCRGLLGQHHVTQQRLGSGDSEIQITGDVSGFGMHGGNGLPSRERRREQPR